MRICHWSLAGFFALAYWLGSAWPALHSHAGYTLALLVAFRVLWGFVGEGQARFRAFVTTPIAALKYFAAQLRGAAPRYAGHDPAGAMMILALLTCLTISAASGMALYAMEGRGPLAATAVAGWPDLPLLRIHRSAADVAIVLVTLHVLGVLWQSWAQRENLVRAMISGRKSMTASRTDG